ncbi:MAG: 4Fe-4S binding protein [Thaumarchaeota archaeon]|nr:4Fe-4S binding protein [Nitrososphaerota archaeon]
MDIGTVVRDSGSTIHAKKSGWRSTQPLIDYKRCTSCGWCWAYCPEPAIRLEGGKYIIDYSFCKGCGICAVECPLHCISMVME